MNSIHKNSISYIFCHSPFSFYSQYTSCTCVCTMVFDVVGAFIKLNICNPKSNQFTLRTNGYFFEFVFQCNHKMHFPRTRQQKRRKKINKINWRRRDAIHCLLVNTQNIVLNESTSKWSPNKCVCYECENNFIMAYV